MGFHQYQMTRQVIFLQTELVPTQRMLKPRIEIESLPEDDEDIYYLKAKFETYLQRPTQLAPLYIQSFINGGHRRRKEVLFGGADNHSLRAKRARNFWTTPT